MSWLPPDLPAAATLGLIAASCFTSFLTAAFGIGGGLVLLAVLAAVLPPAALIPVHGVVQLGSNVGRAAVLRKHVAWQFLPPFLAGSAGGAILGGSLVVSLPPGVVQAGVGLFIVWSVFFRPPRAIRRFAWLTGALSSFLTMFFGATGPFVMAYLRTLDLERHALVGTHATFMTLQHLLKTLVFGLLGFAFAPWLPLIVAMIASGFLGTLVGRAVLTRTDETRFSLVLNTILLILAARLIWAGLSG